MRTMVLVDRDVEYMDFACCELKREPQSFITEHITFARMRVSCSDDM